MSTYRKRLAEFWKDFRRSKTGLLGIVILAIFVGISIFASQLAPNDPVLDRSLADQYAAPDWIGIIDPSRAGLPPNVVVDVVEYALQNETALSISNSSLIRIDVDGGFINANFSDVEGNFQGKEFITMNAEFTYDYDTPAIFGFFIDGKLGNESTDLFLTADFTIAKPDGETIRIWDSSLTPNFRQVLELGEEFKVNSADQRLVIPLGLPYFRDALARRIFNESGTYELTMNFFFNDYQSGHPSSLDLRLDRINFRVFGERFGLLGTDNYGRDIFSQVVHGTSISLMVGIAAALLTVSLSVMVGVTSAYLGGRTDAVLMRLADLVMALPALAFMIVIAAMIEGGVLQIVILLSLLGWAAGARNIRAYVLSIKESTYIEAAKAKGAGNWRIIFRHILPAVLPIAYAAVAIAAPYAIVTESELSYLGIGGDPFSISWGRMLQAAQTGGALQLGTWWWIVPPGAAIALLSLAFVALGHALDEVLNPRLRKRR